MVQASDAHQSHAPAARGTVIAAAAISASRVAVQIRDTRQQLQQVAHRQRRAQRSQEHGESRHADQRRLPHL